MSRLNRFPTPSPAFALALVAVVLSATGLAVAAIPDSKGVIHSCYAKSDGALRVVSGKKCQSGEKKLAWNKQGQPGKTGKTGAAGATHVTVRSTNLTYHYGTCAMFGPSMYSCVAPGASGTAHCNPGERATGGGYDKSNDGSAPTFTQSTPTPSVGTPTGWTFTTTAAVIMSSTATPPDGVLPVRVICAAP